MITAATKAQALTIKVHVAREFRVTIQQIDGRDRHKNIAQARQVAMFLARELLQSLPLYAGNPQGPISFPDIATVFKREEHVSGLYCVRTVVARCKASTEFKARVDKLRAAIVAHFAAKPVLA
jgi:chromosomal replication initiation ATPase DnaA